MTGLDLPFQPIRSELYTPAELYHDFDTESSSSWGGTVDFSIYRHFVKEGRNAPANPYTGMMQALHDSAITQATLACIANRKVAAIMGGHKMGRGDASYKAVAILARRLTRNGILTCSGGGPGAMEAAHLGAALAGEPDSRLDLAVGILRKQPTVPSLASIVASDGTVDATLVAQAHAWFKPAFDIARGIASPKESLAIPTWHYGHEPTTPFATHIAKYFQNSIREDGLLALAKQGVVYSEGKAGTIQEIFQDGAQNYYRSFGCFSPMVFLGKEYWTATYPVVAVLQKLFATADFGKYVLVTDDVDSAATFIEEYVS